MANIQVGGDPERYMQAPLLSVSDSKGGGGNFLSSLLDLLGVHRQVAKGPKNPAPQVAVPDSLAAASTVLSGTQMADPDWGLLASQSKPIPIQKIDPNSGF